MECNAAERGQDTDLQKACRRGLHRKTRDEEAAALGTESGQHSTVNRLAAAWVIVNSHPLLSERDALHHERAALIEEIGAPGRDGARL